MSIEEIGPGRDGRTPTHVLMDYLSDMRDFELWASSVAPVDSGDFYDERDFAPLAARLNQIRSRHCTPRAQQVWASALSFASPPENDPASTEIVAVTMTSAGRVRIATAETNQNLTETKEYSLQRVRGEWRLNSAAYPREDDEWPRVKIPL
jgi:hypothetical protein